MTAAGRRWKPVAVAAAAAVAVAVLGAVGTDLGEGYDQLRQPAWKPPDGAFGTAWTLIFSLTAVAGVWAWRDAPDRPARERLLALFARNRFLNVLWSLLHFRLRRPDWALAEVVFLWLGVALLIGVLGRYSRRAAWMLVPYLVWVAYAGALNGATVSLNAPFGG